MTLLLLLAWVLAFAEPAPSQQTGPQWAGQPVKAPAESSGAAFVGRRLFTWGPNGLWSLHPESDAEPRQYHPGPFGAAGCFFDVDGDRHADLVLQQQDRLVWLRGPAFSQASVIDTGAGMSDCLGMTLLGRRGVLVAHRGLQVRFYEPARGAWPYREIYSFYTASFQSGLAVRDVDGDGNPDLYSGNYWIRSPEQFDLPWRLFAINIYNEMPDSAHVRLAPLRAGGSDAIVVSQGELEQDARIAIFRKPPDPRQLWDEERLDEDLAASRPGALAVGDLNRDGRDDVVIGESGGEGRLWIWLQQGNGRFRRVLVRRGQAVHSVFLQDRNGDGHPDIVGVGPSAAYVLLNPRLE